MKRTRKSWKHPRNAIFLLRGVRLWFKIYLSLLLYKNSQNYRGLKSLLHFLFTFIAGTKRRSAFSRARKEPNVQQHWNCAWSNERLKESGSFVVYENSFIPFWRVTGVALSFWGKWVLREADLCAKISVSQSSGVSRGWRSQKEKERRKFLLSSPRVCFSKLP